MSPSPGSTEAAEQALRKDLPLPTQPMPKSPIFSAGLKTGLKSRQRPSWNVGRKCKGLPSSNAQPSVPWEALASLRGRDLQPSSQRGGMISCCAVCFSQGHALEDTVEQDELTSLQLQLCLQMALPLSAKRNEKQCKPWSLGSTAAKLLIPGLRRPISHLYLPLCSPEAQQTILLLPAEVPLLITSRSLK